MSVSAGHFQLSAEQKRFKSLIAPYPSIASFWDFQQCNCLLDDLHHALRVFSTGEKIMAQFFMLVWLGQNVAGFDLAAAAKNLGEKDLSLIATWLADPFFP